MGRKPFDNAAVPAHNPVRGLECRKGGCRHLRVLYTRRAFGGKLIRRRECRNCGMRFSTWEEEAGR